MEINPHTITSESSEPQGSRSFGVRVNGKKRILFIVTLSEIGGAQRFINTLTSNLDPQKYEWSIATSDNVKNLKRNPSIFNDILAIFEIRKLIKNYNPDVVFLNSSKAGFIGSLATVFPKKLKNIKVVYRIGGWTFNDPWPKWKKWFWIWLEKISANWKDIIIVNNEHDYDRALRLKIRPREKLILIYNGLDVYKMEFLPRDEARIKLFEKIAKHSGKIFQIKYVIGTIANFYPTKGIKYLIKAAEQFKNRDDLAFIVLGDGTERKLYEEQIAQFGLQNKVFLVGQIKDGYKYLSAFDIFVLPSVKEGFPWALIEAMAAKLPVIATRVGAVPEIIEDGKNGFIIETRNTEQMVNKINQLIEDDRLRMEFGIQAHQTVLFKFPLDKMVSQIEELL